MDEKQEKPPERCGFCNIAPAIVAEVETLPPVPLSVACKTRTCPLYNVIIEFAKWQEVFGPVPAGAERDVWDEAIRIAKEAQTRVTGGYYMRQAIVTALEAARDAAPAADAPVPQEECCRAAVRRFASALEEKLANETGATIDATIQTVKAEIAAAQAGEDRPRKIFDAGFATSDAELLDAQ